MSGTGAAQPATLPVTPLIGTLRSYLADPNARVSRNAAIALAALSDDAGIGVLIDEALAAHPSGTHSRVSAEEELLVLTGPRREAVLRTLDEAARTADERGASAYDLLTRHVRQSGRREIPAEPISTWLTIRRTLRQAAPPLRSMAIAATLGGVVGSVAILTALLPQARRAGVFVPGALYPAVLLFGATIGVLFTMAVRQGLRSAGQFPSLKAGLVSQASLVGVHALAALAVLAFLAYFGLRLKSVDGAPKTLLAVVTTGALAATLARITVLWAVWRLGRRAGAAPVHAGMWASLPLLAICGYLTHRFHAQGTRPGLEWLAVAAVVPMITALVLASSRIDSARMPIDGPNADGVWRRWPIGAISVVAALGIGTWWWRTNRPSVDIVDDPSQVRVGVAGMSSKHRAHLLAFPVRLRFAVEFGQKVTIDIPQETQALKRLLRQFETRSTDFAVTLLRTSRDPLCSGTGQGAAVVRGDDPPSISTDLFPGCYEAVVSNSRTLGSVLPGSRLGDFLNELLREGDASGPPYWVDVVLNADRASPRKSSTGGTAHAQPVSDPAGVVTWVTDASGKEKDQYVSTIALTKAVGVYAAEVLDPEAVIKARSATSPPTEVTLTSVREERPQPNQRPQSEREIERPFRSTQLNGWNTEPTIRLEPGNWDILVTSRRGPKEMATAVSVGFGDAPPLKQQPPEPIVASLTLNAARLVQREFIADFHPRIYRFSVTRRTYLHAELTPKALAESNVDLTLALMAGDQTLDLADDPETLEFSIDPGTYSLKIAPYEDFDGTIPDIAPQTWVLRVRSGGPPAATR